MLTCFQLGDTSKSIIDTFRDRYIERLRGSNLRVEIYGAKFDPPPPPPRGRIFNHAPIRTWINLLELLPLRTEYHAVTATDIIGSYLALSR